MKFKKNILFIIFVVLIIIWSVGPIFLGIIVSLSPEKNLASKPPIINLADFNFKNYITLLIPGGVIKSELVESQSAGAEGAISFRKGLINSLNVGIMTMVINTFLSIIAGYAFTKFKLKIRNPCFLVIILTIPIPYVAFTIPLIRLMAELQLTDTYLGLSLIYTSLLFPITMWVAISYFFTIPKEIEEASYVDGCNKFMTFFKILIPLALPVIGAIAIISFISSWSQFFVPFIFAPHDAKQVTVAITDLVGKATVNRNTLATAGVISLFIPALLVVLFSRIIIAGLTSGAVKE